MKKALRKDCFKEIKKSYKRFISILLMAFLGVGFFAGVRATSPDMKLTLDKYLDEKNVYDIRLVSTLGLTDEDILEISKLNGIQKVIGTYNEDVFVSFDEEETVVKVYSLENDINELEILEGKLPENDTECVIDETMKTARNVKIGDYIEIEENLSEDEEANFKNTKLKVVGIVKSPLYISRDRGTTNLGSGKIAYYVYVNKSNIISDIYTEIDIIVDGAKEELSISEEYDEKVEDVQNELETIKEKRQTARYEELINEANTKLADSQKEFNEQKKEAEDKIKEAEQEIEDGKEEIESNEKELENAEKELQSGKEEANEQFSLAENQIQEGENKLNTSQAELNQSRELLNTKKQEAQEGINQINSGIDTINSKLEELNSQKASAETVLNSLEQINTNINNLNLLIKQYEKELEENPENTDEIKQKIEETKFQLITLEEQKKQLESLGISEETINLINSGIEECNKQKNDLQVQLNTINSELVNAENQLNSGQAQIDSGRAEIEVSKAQLESSKAETETKFQEAEKEIENGKKEISNVKKELEEGEKKLEEEKEKFNTEIADAEAKLIEAREKVNDIENPKWYIFSRTDNEGFNSFSQDTENIEKLGEAFPIVFFIIATLISLTSMSRMVEEERVQIGTLKALGYSRHQIISKYIIYSLLASLIGGVLGSIFGLQFFPTVIISMYQMMYNITNTITEFNEYYAFTGIAIMVLCIVGTTIYTAMKELKSTPAELMRPKAPKAGKRVLLEKIPFIWKRLNFTQKVTIRNMFRYKQRFFMTVIGICGCTALILTGFGLKDSISKIMDYQYIDIYDYDMLIGLKDTLTDEEKSSLISELENKEEISKCVEVYINSESVKNNNIQEDAQIVVTDNPENLESVIRLKDYKTGEKLNLNDNEIILTEKLAELIGANVGSEISLVDSDNNEYKVKVGGITEHYISHYVYISKNLYEKVFEESVSTNVLFAQYSNEISEEEENKLSEDILSNSKVASITLTTSLMQTMDDTLSAMNLVVYVLIISAGLLAFIVLYNLANINISERIRELATIKVLGFYDKEVYDYVTREIILLTIIGIIFGLIFGTFLDSFILKTCEIGILRFKRVITIPSYIYSMLITIAFTLIVNFITYFSLKKIDMIESLKSVE